MLMESRKLYLNPYIESVTVFPEMVTSVTDLSLEIEPIEIPWATRALVVLETGGYIGVNAHFHELNSTYMMFEHR